MRFRPYLFAFAAPTLDVVALMPTSGVSSILERDAELSINLLQIRAVSMLAGLQTPCEYCQSECLAVAAEFTQQCAEKRACDSLEVGIYACLDRCKQRGKKRAKPCIEKCSCSQKELHSQEKQEVKRAEAEAEIMDDTPTEEIADIISDGDDEQDEQEVGAEQEEAEGGQVAEDDGVPETEEDPFTIDDFEGDPDQAELHQQKKVPAADFYQQIRQSPCAFCQSECLVVEVSFADRCAEKRNCDALVSGSAKCRDRCQERGTKRAKPCLEACPCSEKELEGQEDKEEARADKDNAKSGSEKAAEIADIIGGAEDESAEEEDSEEGEE